MEVIRRSIAVDIPDVSELCPIRHYLGKTEMVNLTGVVKHTARLTNAEHKQSIRHIAPERTDDRCAVWTTCIAVMDEKLIANPESESALAVLDILLDRHMANAFCRVPFDECLFAGSCFSHCSISRFQMPCLIETSNLPPNIPVDEMVDATVPNVQVPHHPIIEAHHIMEDRPDRMTVRDNQEVLLNRLRLLQDLGVMHDSLLDIRACSSLDLCQTLTIRKAKLHSGTEHLRNQTSIAKYLDKRLVPPVPAVILDEFNGAVDRFLVSDCISDNASSL